MAFRRKRSDTKVSTIEREHHVDLGFPGDATLGEVLDETGILSFTKLLSAAKAPRAQWQDRERDACARRGLEHVGGPGAPDCDGGDHVVEVKHQQRPVTRSQIAEVAEKAWAQGKSLEFVSASGFDKGAREEARARAVKLRRR